MAQTYFSATLSRLIAGRSHSEIAAACGIPRGTISFYASGERGISVTALGQLLSAFSEPHDRLDLVRAHLRDEIPPEVFDQVTIQCREESLREDSPAQPWKKDLDRALDALRTRAETDADVRQLILDLEKVV